MFNGDASSSAARNVVRSSSISGEMYNIERSARGSADSVTITASKKRRSSLGAKMVAIVGLSQWSKSTLQLNQTGEPPRPPHSPIPPPSPALPFAFRRGARSRLPKATLEPPASDGDT